jgi:hypothetical protein
MTKNNQDNNQISSQNPSSSNLHFKLSIFDKDKQQTFENKFYIKQTNDYTDVIKKIADILLEYNIDICLDELAIIVVGGRFPSESSILVQQIED